MRFAAVNLYALPIEHAFFGLDAKSSDLSKRSCAARTDIRGRAIAFDVSERARKEGVVPGMTITEARARLPDLEVKERDASGELQRLRVLAELLYAFGPTVEVAPPSVLFLDLAKPDEAKAAEEIVRAIKRAGHAVTVAIADDVDTARTLAAHRAHEIRARIKIKSKKPPPPLSPVVIVPGGQEIRFLDPLPLEALIWADFMEDPEGIKRERMRAIQASMRVLGIHDVAGLRTLPPAQVASRFGEVGATLMQRASAELWRPLRPFLPPDRIIEEHESEGLLEELESVLFVMKKLFDRVEARLEARSLSAGSLVLGFELEPNEDRAIAHDRIRKATSRERAEIPIQLARPSRRAATMLALAREKISGALPGSIRALSVEARSTALDRGAQLDLFSTYAKKLEDVSEMVGRLVAAFGEDAVFSPEVVDTHRPEAAWAMRPFEIEKALDAFRVEKSPPPPPSLQAEPELLARDAPRSDYVLPSVDDQLCVSVMPSETVESVLSALEEKKKAWPKAIQRKAEDEPLPVLPPRPLELLEVPERATYTRASSGDEGVLLWRGSRLPISGLSGVERIEAEWWTGSPITREYVIAEVADGRRLWLFFEAEGETFVHGLFD